MGAQGRAQDASWPYWIPKAAFIKTCKACPLRLPKRPEQDVDAAVVVEVIVIYLNTMFERVRSIASRARSAQLRALYVDRLYSHEL